MADQIPPSEKINILFEVLVSPSGKPFTSKEVARVAGIQEATLSNLRNNPTVNPLLSTLQGISKFFRVPLDYFNCETDAECRIFLQAPPGLDAESDNLQESPVARQIFFKAMRMSEYGRRELLRMAEVVETADKVVQDRQIQDRPHAASASG